MKKYTVLIIIVLLFSCKKENGNVTITQETDVSFQKDALQKSDMTLKNSAEFTGDWAEIITFEDELKRVLNSIIQSEKDLELLKKLMGDVKDTYPEQFKTPTIEARVKVLDTELLMLEQDLKDGVLVDVLNKKHRIQKAYNVFVGQLEALILKERDYEKYN